MIFSAGSNVLGSTMFKAFPGDTDKRNNKHEVIVSYLPTSPDTSYMNILLLDSATFKNMRNRKTNALMNALVNSDSRVGLIYLKVPKDKVEATIPAPIRELPNFHIVSISKMDVENLTIALESYFKEQSDETLDSMTELDADELEAMGLNSVNSIKTEYGDIDEIRTGGEDPDEFSDAGFTSDIDFDLDGFTGDIKSYYTPESEDSEVPVADQSRTHVPAAGVVNVAATEYTDGEPKIRKPEQMNTSSPFSIPESSTVDSSVSPTTGMLERLKSVEAKTLSKSYLAKVTTDEIHRTLMKENAEYFTAINYLDTLRQSLIALVADRTMPITTKIKHYQEIVGNIVMTKSGSSEMLTCKVIEVIDFGMSIIEETVNRRIDTLSTTVYNMSAETSHERMQNAIGEVIAKRSAICTEIDAIIEGLNAIVSNVTNLTTSTSKHLSKNNITDSAYINEMVIPYVNFNLSKSHDFVLNLLTAAERKTLSISMVDSKLRALLTQAHSLVTIDSDIIARQSELINHLLVTKMSQVVIATTILQNCLTVFIGSEDSGKTVTSLVYSSMLSGNTMLIDMTGKHSLATYTNVIPFEDQMIKMDRSKLLVVEADIHRLDFEAAIVFLRQATVYYSNIVILADTENCSNVLSTFDKEIQNYFCVLQHNKEQFKEIELALSCVDKSNKAIKIVSIDPVLEPLEVFQKLNVELSMVGYVTLPHMHVIKRSTIDNVNPSYNQQVRNEFQKAFGL